MLFEFVLFAILGWCAFANPLTAPGKMVLMVLFVVLMVVWLVIGFTGFNMPHLSFPR